MTTEYAHDPDCNTLHDGPGPCPAPEQPMAVPPGLRRVENDHWIGISGPPAPTLSPEDYERWRDAFLKAAQTGRMTVLPPDPMEALIRESAAAYGQAFVYRDPATGKELVLDPQHVTIVKPPPVEPDCGVGQAMVKYFVSFFGTEDGKQVTGWTEVSSPPITGSEQLQAILRGLPPIVGLSPDTEMTIVYWRRFEEEG